MSDAVVAAPSQQQIKKGGQPWQGVPCVEILAHRTVDNGGWLGDCVSRHTARSHFRQHAAWVGLRSASK